MTYYVAARRFRPDREVVVAPYAAHRLESVAGFEPGDTVTLRDVLYGLLLASGNDAAETLALAVSGSEPDFVVRMNAAADDLGLDETSYFDPIGLNPANVSSARDLVDLSVVLRRQRLFREIVDTPRITLRSGVASIRLESTNRLLLEEPFIDGIKTGTTLEAGYVLVASGHRNGVELVSAVLGAPDEASRDAATLDLLDYGFSLYATRTLLEGGERVGSVPLVDGSGSLGLVASKGVHEVARSDQGSRVKLAAPDSVAAPVAAGDPVGTATVLLEGRKVGEVKALAARSISAPAEADDNSPLPTWAIVVFAAAGIVALVLASVAIAIHRREPR